ncbi:MAG: heme ABC exporter ATP-binding protein CcmA [Alphaproteobacteria bacterium]|jgi:heme exporter protein A|nr:heme ABC exporter ATP-binding protein CcmA [Alphaproteobacteria bacterium]
MSLVLEGVSLVRGGRLLFKELSCTLAPGTLTLLQGKNGQGKTSLLEALMGLIPLKQGRVTWQGRALSPEDFRAVIGEDGLKGSVDVKSHLHLWQSVYGASSHGVNFLEETRALHDKPVASLSAGQRQRLNLSRLFCGKHAPLWFLDEPLTHLDARTKALFLDACADHQAQGGVVIMATHETPSQIFEAPVITLMPAQTLCPTTLRQELQDVALFA